MEHQDHPINEGSAGPGPADAAASGAAAGTDPLRLRRRTALAAAASGAVVVAAGLAACGGSDGGTGPGKRAGRSRRADVTSGQQRFRSLPDLRPPAIRVTHPPDGAGPGRVFLGPRLERGNSRSRKPGETQSGPMIIDERGELVWFRPTPAPRSPYVVRCQQYRGRSVLTWWEGTIVPDHGPGEGVILDDSYREIGRVRAVHGLKADFHEFLIGPKSTAFLICYDEVTADLRAIGGKRHDRMLDAVVQEVDVRTGRLEFQWRASDHIDVRESYEPRARSDPWDFLHMNSIAVLPGGDLLLSPRHASALWRVARPSGRVVWRLGGRRSDFRLGKGVAFTWQHDARRRHDGAITLFDNHARSRRSPTDSRGIAVRLDHRRRRAELLEEYPHPKRGEVAATQGSMQSLAGGTTLLGWGGGNPDWTEQTVDGDRLVYAARIAPHGWETYQVQRSAWTGRPTTRPDVAARRMSAGRTSVAASWNGATEVRRWRVLAGRRRGDLRPVLTVPRAGFETRTELDDRARFVAVEALDAHGHTLGRSASVDVTA